MRKNSLTLTLAAMLACTALLACSPKFDWRDYRSNEAPYAVLFPAKPDSHARNITLEGEAVKMHMTAAEIDGVTFAVGSATMSTAAQAQLAVIAMKNALVRNIDGTVHADKIGNRPHGSAGLQGQQTIVEVEARGIQRGEPIRLVGRFIAQGNRIYQVIIIGREQQVVNEAVDTFMTSFKLN